MKRYGDIWAPSLCKTKVQSFATASGMLHMSKSKIRVRTWCSRLKATRRLRWSGRMARHCCGVSSADLPDKWFSRDELPILDMITHNFPLSDSQVLADFLHNMNCFYDPRSSLNAIYQSPQQNLTSLGRFQNRAKGPQNVVVVAYTEVPLGLIWMARLYLLHERSCGSI